LSQDFAQSIVTAAPNSHKKTPQKKMSKPLFWRFLSILICKKKFYIPSLALAALMLLFALSLALRVDASVPLTQEEWLQPNIASMQDQLPMSQKTVLKSGDSAFSALSRLGLPFAEVMAMQQAAKKLHPLTYVQAGHAFWRQDIQQEMHVFYSIDAEHRLHLQNTGTGWQASIDQRRVTHRQVYVQATISDSLFYAAAQAGMDDRTTMNLVDIFAWDIDFARDLRAGDHFQVLYDERYDEAGKMVGTSILAATFINQGQHYEAFQYQLGNKKVGYFTPKGKSLRKTYLKAPVKYSRISSRFRSARKHPVLGYTRAHKGVDYAAKTGTPVHAIGDGRITYSTWKGGYGRLVEIHHNNRNHSTRYAHLSRFGRGIHKGVRVKQGQIIGYVGMSGLATGPHLHFEFRVRGRAINPLRVKHKAAKPIPANEMAAFRRQHQQLQQQLEYGLQKQTWG